TAGSNSDKNVRHGRMSILFIVSGDAVKPVNDLRPASHDPLTTLPLSLPHEIGEFVNEKHHRTLLIDISTPNDQFQAVGQFGLLGFGPRQFGIHRCEPPSSTDVSFFAVSLLLDRIRVAIGPPSQG